MYLASFGEHTKIDLADFMVKVSLRSTAHFYLILAIFFSNLLLSV